MTGVAALLLCAMPPLGAQQVILTGKATSIAEQKRALAQATAQALTARRLSHQMEAPPQATAPRLAAPMITGDSTTAAVMANAALPTPSMACTLVSPGSALM